MLGTYAYNDLGHLRSRQAHIRTYRATNAVAGDREHRPDKSAARINGNSGVSFGNSGVSLPINRIKPRLADREHNIQFADNLGRRMGLTRGSGTTATYTWDNASRLSQLVENMTGTAHDQTLGFSYNPASQITTRTGPHGAHSWHSHYNVSRGCTPDGLVSYLPISPLALQMVSKRRVSIF